MLPLGFNNLAVLQRRLMDAVSSALRLVRMVYSFMWILQAFERFRRGCIQGTGSSSSVYGSV